MERRGIGIVREGVVVPYGTTEFEEGVEVEIVYRPKQSSHGEYRLNRYSLQFVLTITTLACCVAASPRYGLLLLFIVAGFGVGIACIRGAWTHRATGWFSGVLFGFIILLMMAASIFGQWRP